MSAVNREDVHSTQFSDKAFVGRLDKQCEAFFGNFNFRSKA